MAHPKVSLIDSPRQKLDLVVIGGSAGAFEPLCFILTHLPEGFQLPMAIVLHRPKNQTDGLAEFLRDQTGHAIKEASRGEPVQSGSIYVAPSNHHLLITRTRAFSLSQSKPIRHSRPSIDVLFNSAANLYGSQVVGILLSGASSDGSFGIKKIRRQGGIGIVQNPSSAEFSFMPRRSLEQAGADYVFNKEQIAMFLNECHQLRVKTRDVNRISNEEFHG